WLTSIWGLMTLPAPSRCFSRHSPCWKKRQAPIRPKDRNFASGWRCSIKARKSLESLAGPDTMVVAEVKVGLAQTVLSQGRAAEACRLMDEALPIHEK